MVRPRRYENEVVRLFTYTLCLPTARKKKRKTKVSFQKTKVKTRAIKRQTKQTSNAKKKANATRAIWQYRRATGADCLVCRVTRVVALEALGAARVLFVGPRPRVRGGLSGPVRIHKKTDDRTARSGRGRSPRCRARGDERGSTTSTTARKKRESRGPGRRPVDATTHVDEREKPMEKPRAEGPNAKPKQKRRRRPPGPAHAPNTLDLTTTSRGPCRGSGRAAG